LQDEHFIQGPSCFVPQHGQTFSMRGWKSGAGEVGAGASVSGMKRASSGGFAGFNSLSL